MDHVQHVKLEVKNHFESRFQEVGYRRPILLGVSLKHVYDEDRVSLEIPFSLGDLNDVIWSCEGDKILSPDGFNMVFLKAC